MRSYDKLKKKYEDEIGPGGAVEAKQKAEKLERDLAALREVVNQLRVCVCRKWR